ncbi:MAG: sigma 54-interacting transcriptional regulator [Labilithrix sp.]|nr:sigma 54-interacting transcriptional regulator [Labilithrix sp.]
MAKPSDETELEGQALISALAGNAYVVVAEGTKLAAVALPKNAELLVGRAEDVDVVLEDAKASRHHARIVSQAARIVLIDLGSRNGTKLGGAVVRGEEVDLRPGDVVGIGSATLTLVCTRDGAELATTPATTHPGFVMADPAMLAIFQTAQRFARVDTPVLLLGETGVGKEVVAGQIHELSPRKKGPFVALNCAALPENIVESELFGHEKGAFTGADRRKIGFLEAAHEGTLFLDEIGDMPPTTQVKLLRFLETRKLTRVGSTTEIAVDARIVAATHRELGEAIRAGRFREDLFYRLSTCTLKIPPLRARPAEITPLAALFAKGASAKLGMPPPVFEPAALAALGRHPWPGNVRELRNAVEHAVVMSDGRTVRATDLPEAIRERRPTTNGSLPGAIADVERERIARALEDEGHNQTRAAARLGISRRALLYKMAKYEIGTPGGARRSPRDRS